MAFSSDTETIIARLRIMCLSSLGDDDNVRRTVQPKSVRYDISPQTDFKPMMNVSESPPISLDSMNNAVKEIQRYHEADRKESGYFEGNMKIRQTQHESTPESTAENNGTSSLDKSHAETGTRNEAPGLSYTTTIRGKDRKVKPNAVQHYNRGQSLSNDSIKSYDNDTSVTRRRSLGLIEERADESDSLDSRDTFAQGGPGKSSESHVFNISTPANNENELNGSFEVDEDGITDQSEGSKKTLQEETMSKPVKQAKNTNLHDDATKSKIYASNGDNYNNSDDDYDDDDDDDDDEYDDDDDDEESSSLDSAFTDIETDSMLDSSVLLESYEYGLYSFPNKESSRIGLRSETKKSRRKKAKSGSLDRSHLKSSIPASSQSKVLKESTPVFQPLSEAESNKQPPGDTDLTFPKVATVVNNKTNGTPQKSNLSALIDSKFKNTDKNPLEYFAFAASDGGNHKTEINIFVPPSNKPIRKVTVNDNIAISSCIGYILLFLYQIPSFKNEYEIKYMNPNLWRLELVDEDGENYGSFGILDRTRILRTYNNPKELALCRVTDKQEMLRNEKQSKLPLEFKQALIDLEKTSKNDESTSGYSVELSKSEIDNKVELKIIINLSGAKYTSHNNRIIEFFMPIQATVGDLLRDVCNEHKMDSTKFCFREVQLQEKGKDKLSNIQLGDSNMMNSLSTNLNQGILSATKSLKDSDSILDLTSNTLELISKNNPDIQSNVVSLSDPSHLGITPSELTLTTPTMISPAKQLEGKVNKTDKKDKKHNGHMSKSKSTAQSIKNTIRSNNYLDNILAGKNPELPTNINTIYFKWTVWRRKHTLINKIEKSLIIDGDYIHLAPSDIIVSNKNQMDNPFLNNSSQTNAHLHHLHHYNYSNYYTSSMMKTSSFHVTQIIKLKRYVNSKNPNHFKIVINKQLDNPNPNTKDSKIKKKYDLEAVNSSECEEIIHKINWVLQVYKMSYNNGSNNSL
ncbi:Piso0_001517 [Millerozyma farinosa CBS 7064]|uniref:Piso0_001517 protein n=1 Tax=Pichia sorbitophila (strain ATCC MYA-4447 / BCRC 22081 / CBS 7064 / NBRC 10061 / NRRL Y-12695) TaxID=559304 RepID=G8YND5_PICSO|nr:Piso0_001517 [Millerozyma farinosa CBS 7064]